MLVEEADEVLESLLMRLLGPSVRHLIQFGDNFQLPPKVKHHDFQVSYFCNEPSSGVQCCLPCRISLLPPSGSQRCSGEIALAT